MNLGQSVISYLYIVWSTVTPSVGMMAVSMINGKIGTVCVEAAGLQTTECGPGSGRQDYPDPRPPPRGGERGETTKPGSVFFNTSSGCRRQPDERCRPACANRLPTYMVRLVRLRSRHRLFTELALDTHTHTHGARLVRLCSRHRLFTELALQ